MSENDNAITVLKQANEKLEQENKQLKTRITQVEKEQLEYLQNVSHQIVAPLNAIKWHIENLTAENPRIGVERAKKVLKSIYSQATIAVHLAKNFNLLSNLEADHDLSKLREPLEEIELRRLLVNIANDFQPLGWDKEIKIIVDDDHFDKLPTILAMKPLISQVFSNIIENAIKYSDSISNVIIEGKYLKDTNSFCVSIRDKGIKIRSDHEFDIFNRGFRCDEAKQKYPAGTGYGLYIARRIVEIHKGKIRVYTSKGWTIFEVTLTVQGLKGEARIRE
jgi:signal transduction histidine kinase